MYPLTSEDNASAMSVQQQFEAAAKQVEQLTRRPSNEELLQLYALYKQATEGDINGPPPSGFDFKGLAKYQAWAALKGKPQEAAMQEYILLVKTLLENYR
jgi:acyl-CoA-binding protein